MRGLVVHGDVPASVEAAITERQTNGLALYDEVWEGVYHMNPAPGGPHARIQAAVIAFLARWPGFKNRAVLGPFNLGSPDDYRVPDGGVVERRFADSTWVPTAQLVVEVISPGEDPGAKFRFYAAHHIGWLLVVNLDGTTWMYQLTVEGYQERDHDLAVELDRFLQQERRRG